MHWALDPEQLMLQDALADWLQRVADPAVVRGWLDTGDTSAFDSILTGEGWLALGTSEERGGQGGGLLELALAAEQFGRFAAPDSGWLATVLALPAIDDATATSALEDGTHLAVAVRSDRPVGAGALVESGGTITGTVELVLGGADADRFVVPAGGHLHLVDASGAEVAPEPLLDRSRSVATVRFDTSPATPLEADAAAFLAATALRSAVLLAADALGAATRMLELAVAYSKQRTQFGAPIGTFQAVKHAAATMLVAEESSRSLAYYAAASVDAGLEDAPLHAAAAKAQVTRAAAETAEASLTLHGAIGYTWEHDLQLFYKRAKLDVALLGAPGVWEDRIADALELVASA